MARDKDKPAFDPAIPEPILRRVFEEQGVPSRWSPDLQALLSPSIAERPLHLPGLLAIERRINTEVEFYWARDRNGTSPNHDRVGELRGQGFEFAHSDANCSHTKDCHCDVIMRNKSVIMGTNEIRTGDLILMKVPKTIWQGIRKSHQLQSLRQTSPRQQQGKSIMSTLNSLPGVRSDAVSDSDLADLAAKRVYGEPNDLNANAARYQKPKDNPQT